MRSRAETRGTHLASPRRFANVGERSRESRIDDTRASEREGGKVAVDILVMPEARSERRRSGGEGEFSPLPRRRKAWFVPLLCLCLPFLCARLVYLVVRPPLARQSARVRFYACVHTLLHIHTQMCASVHTECTLKR